MLRDRICPLKTQNIRNDPASVNPEPGSGGTRIMAQYFAFQWHITEECDQRCKHCYIFAENACKALKSMKWEDMQKVVENAEDFCRTFGRLPYFYITGGDPILHPDF